LRGRVLLGLEEARAAAGRTPSEPTSVASDGSVEAVGFYRGGGRVRPLPSGLKRRVRRKEPGRSFWRWGWEVGGAAPVARRMAGWEGKAARRRVQAGTEEEMRRVAAECWAVGSGPEE